MERQDTSPFNPKASFLRDDDAEPPDRTAADRAPAKSSFSFGHESFTSDTAEGGRMELERRANFVRAPSSYTVSASAQLRWADASPNKVAAEIAATVKAHFRDQLPASLAKDYDQRDSVGPFKTNEIVLGPKLGSGGFSPVFEICAFRPDPATAASVNAAELEAREQIQGREKYHDTNKACYVVDHLCQELLRKYDTMEYVQAASDLMQEVEFLAVLQHPSIIKLHSVAFGGAKGVPAGFKVVLPHHRLPERHARSAPVRLGQGEMGGGVAKKLQRKMSGVDEEEVSNVTEEQLEVPPHIVSALCFLHQTHIMFRDLKPDIVGFNVR